MLKPIQNYYFKKSAVALALSAVAASAFPATNEELDQRIRILERQLENQQEAADAKAKTAAKVSADSKGFSIKSTDGDYELKIKALIQADTRYFLDNQQLPVSSDTFLLRRLRPTFEGALGKYVGFRLTPEFAGGGVGAGTAGSGDGLLASIVDAYVDLKFDPAASVRIGKQKGPIGLERLQSGGAISFIERGYVTELVPNRDIGAALFGQFLDGRLSYTVGLFNGTADGRDIATNDVDRRYETEGRIFAEPFKNDPGYLQGLGFGIGGSIGNKISAAGGANNTAVLPRYRSPGQNTIFQYVTTASANGSHNRLVPQVTYYYNQFGLLAEYARNNQEVANAGVTKNFRNDGFEVTTTYVITGEDASFKGVVNPTSPFTLGGDGWGAFELAGRYGELRIDDEVFTAGFASRTASISRAKSFGVGINWYLNSNLKLVLDYNQSAFTGGTPASSGSTNRELEKALFARVQVTY